MYTHTLRFFKSCTSYILSSQFVRALILYIFKDPIFIFFGCPGIKTYYFYIVQFPAQPMTGDISIIQHTFFSVLGFSKNSFQSCLSLFSGLSFIPALSTPHITSPQCLQCLPADLCSLPPSCAYFLPLREREHSYSVAETVQRKR